MTRTSLYGALDGERAGRIRTLTKRLDFVHTIGYFTPHVSREMKALGVTDGAARNLAGRASALGITPAAVVVAAYANYSERQLAAALPGVWDTITPAQASAARLRGIEKIYAELFAASPQAEELTAAAERVVAGLQPVLSAMTLTGRPMFAGQRALYQAEPPTAQDPANQPFIDLFAAVTLLREYRGDAHTAALTAAGVDGLQAMILDAATGKSFNPAGARLTRGWSEEEWREAARQLAELGLITDATDAAFLTEAGQELRDHVEYLTHVGVQYSWAATEDDTIASLNADAKLFAGVINASGLIPANLFGHGSEQR